MNQYKEKIQHIIEEISKVIIGKQPAIKTVLTAILAQGHILIEDVPGVGKTTIALAFSKTMELDHKRMQFTPDVLPTDLVGFHVLNEEREFVYKEGSVMCNLFLADEINRTSSKTQSALLEVMEEGNVTIDGVTKEVPKPFIVIATQNPLGSIGTQMLPESQLDRFMVKMTIGYPAKEQEIAMLRERHGKDPMEQVQRVVSIEELRDMQRAAEQVYVQEDIYEYAVALVGETRNHELLELGLSPRGTLALIDMAKAAAFVEGRDYVLPEDIKNYFKAVGAHRIILNAKAKLGKNAEEQVLDEILKKVKVPDIR